MTVQAADTSVRKSIVVEAPIERAFSVFTEGIGELVRPREHNILDEELAETVFEPRVGGNVYDRGVNGGECRWARVLAYEPPDRFVISWDITPEWQLETDLAKTSEVEVRFIAEAPDRTRVELEHRNLDRHGDGWEPMRDSIGSGRGWSMLLERFADAARAVYGRGRRDGRRGRARPRCPAAPVPRARARTQGRRARFRRSRGAAPPRAGRRHRRRITPTSITGSPPAKPAQPQCFLRLTN